MKFKKTIENFVNDASAFFSSLIVGGMVFSSSPSMADVNKLAKPMADKTITIDWLGSCKYTWTPDSKLQEGDKMELRKLDGIDTVRVALDSTPKDGWMTSSFDYTDISSPEKYFLRYRSFQEGDIDTTISEDTELIMNKIHKSAYRYQGDISWVDWYMVGEDTTSVVNSLDVFRPVYYCWESWPTNVGVSNLMTDADAYPYNGETLQVGDNEIDSQDLIAVINAWRNTYVLNGENVPMHVPNSFSKSSSEIPVFTDADSSFTRNDSLFIPVYADIDESLYSYEFANLRSGKGLFEIIDIIPGDYLKDVSNSNSLGKLSKSNDLESLSKGVSSNIALSQNDDGSEMYLKQDSDVGFNYLGTLFGRQENVFPNSKKLMTVVGRGKKGEVPSLNEIELLGKYDLVQEENGLAKKVDSGFIDGFEFLTSIKLPKDDFENNKNLLCYPNPFNAEMNVKYKIENKTRANITIYDNLGQQVRILVNRDISPGIYQVQWDGKNKQKEVVSSGIYYMVFKTDNDLTSSKVVRLR